MFIEDNLIIYQQKHNLDNNSVINSALHFQIQQQHNLDNVIINSFCCTKKHVVL
jgi:hypothetical protein